MADKSRLVHQSTYRLRMTNQISKFLIAATSKALTPQPVSDRYSGLTNGSGRASLSVTTLALNKVQNKNMSATPGWSLK